jgi:hypothetical protein
MDEKNYGLRPNEPLVATAYVAGENSPLTGEDVNPTGDWQKYVPTGEWQRDPKVPNSDKLECVTQSHHHSIATILYFDHLTGRMPETHWNWLQKNGYINEQGRPDFNERLSAISNGTTHDGNWLYNVAEDARKVGLFPKGIIPDDKSLSWNVYYDKSLLTPERLAIGKEFLKWFGLNYEWADIRDLGTHIKQSPLQITKPGHAIEEITKPEPLKYFDSYSPFIKTLSINNVTSAMKHFVTYKKGSFMNDQVKLIKIDKTVYVGIGAKDIPQLVAVSEAFGKKAEINDKGEVTNLDIIK